MVVLEVRGFLPYQPVCPPSRLADSFYFDKFNSYARIIYRGKSPPKPTGAKALGLTSSVWKLTKRCLHKNPIKRPDTSEVLAHLEGRSIARPARWWALDARRYQFAAAAPALPQQPKEYSRQERALESSGVEEHVQRSTDLESTIPIPMTVRCGSVLSISRPHQLPT